MLVVVGPVGEREHLMEGHVERPDRVVAAFAGLRDLDLGDDLRMVTPEPAALEDLLRVHEARYLERLASSPEGWIDSDTFLKNDSFETARRAAGAGICAIATLDTTGADVGFVLARPPGHHAERDRGMGFCLLNSVAVAAAHLTARGERVLIVDWDVHHGNGTQSIFYDDPDVLYVSTHQSPLYPGTGRTEEVGGTRAAGLTVNVPLPSGATGDVVCRALQEVAAPAVERFRPSWTLVSAGFDAHRADPLAGLSLSSGDFADLALIVRALNSGASGSPSPILLFLEGGYDLASMRSSVAATLSALMGASLRAERPTSGGPGMEAVAAASRVYLGDDRVRDWLES